MIFDAILECYVTADPSEGTGELNHDPILGSTMSAMYISLKKDVVYLIESFGLVSKRIIISI